MLSITAYTSNFNLLNLGHFEKILLADKLDITKLGDVVNILEKHNFCKADWEDLGLKLGLYQPTLRTIAKQFSEDINGAFKQCLSLWLKGQDEVAEKGGATWKSLVNAIRKMGNNALADDIENEKQ